MRQDELNLGGSGNTDFANLVIKAVAHKIREFLYHTTDYKTIRKDLYYGAHKLPQQYRY
jgi:hypothetical protein